MKTFFFTSLLTFLIRYLNGQSEDLEYNTTTKTILEAESEVIYDQRLKRLVATPNARLVSGEILLTAERIEYDQNQSDVLAIGKVILSDGIIRLLADKIEVNLKSGDFNASEVKAGIYPWAIKSNEVYRKETIINGIDSSLYILGKEENDPILKIQKLSFEQNDRSIKANKVKLRIGDHWVGTLPFLRGKVKKNHLKHKLTAGKNNNLGWFFGTGGKWMLNPIITTESGFHAYSKRGLLLEPSLSWNSEHNSSLISGSIESGMINDRGDMLGEDLRGMPIGNRRYYLKAQSINQINDNFRIAGLFEKEKDSDVFRDFQRARFSDYQWNDSFGEISYHHKNWTISSLTRWQANEYESTIEQMPNIRFDLPPTQLMDSKIYNSLAFEFSALREKGHWGQLLQKSNKLDLGYKVIRPTRLPQGFVFSPHLSYRRQDYSLDGPNANRSFAEWGNELRYELLGDYDWKNATWKIDQIRHIMGFSIAHRNTKRIHQSEESLIPKIDQPIYNLNLGSIDLMDQIEADELVPFEIVRIGWENEILTQTLNNTKSLASLDFYQDLYHRKQNQKNQKNEFFSNLSVRPANWITFNGQSKIDTEQGKVLRNSFSIWVTDGTINNFQVGYFKYLKFSDQWRLSGSHLWSEHLRILGSISFETDTSEVPFWQTAIEIKSSPMWTWVFSLAKRDGTSKENNTEFSIGTRIFAF